jgi:hypothetical protein
MSTELIQNPRAYQQTDWQMPAVEKGDLVLIFTHPGSKDSTSAIVNKVGPRGVYVNAFENFAPQLNTYPRASSGIRHADDPDLGRGIEATSLCWRESHQTSRLRRLEEGLAALKKQLGVLDSDDSDETE